MPCSGHLGAEGRAQNHDGSVLRFSSVKNEELDWRPAETITEDYYVF